MNKNLFSDMQNGLPRAIACAIYPQGGERECLVSLSEMGRLLDTAGAEMVATVTQMRDKPDGVSCIGSGKLKELSDLCLAEDVSIVVFDCELSPSQIRTIEERIEAEVEVLDRSMLILDIFARHAVTSEGRLQVELAQLRYTAPRLAGKGTEMSRLGGGIGTRGPGETKLEIDRRRIKSRIRMLEEELEKVESSRATMRAARDRSGLVRCAIVGYTNAGKSTLLNALTGAGILAEDKLFATLDPTTRQYVLPSGMKILLTDTVGFIRNLPHHLIKAFRSTLEEAALADVILHVCDASGEEFADELKITDNLLTELGASGKPVLLVFNKCDLIADREQKMLLQRIADQGGCEAVFISAKTGEGMDEFTEKLERIASEGRCRVEFLIPYADGGALNLLHALAHDIVTEYADNGVRVTATVDAKTKGKLREYLVVPDTVDGSGEDEEDW